jgi:hypothetical protein
MAAEKKEVVASIYKQADEVGNKSWKDLSKQGETIAKTHELLDIMHMMKLRNAPGNTKGVGIGPKPDAIEPDGIDAKITRMGSKIMEPGVLSKEQPDLIRMAQTTAAIASVSVHQCTVDKKMGDQNPADWKKWMEDMHRSSLELIEALKKKDPKAVQKSSSDLRTSCTECHRVFRDQ